MALDKETTKALQPLLPWIVAFLFGASAWVKLREPATNRPREPAQATTSVSPWSRDARLWEDPFAALPLPALPPPSSPDAPASLLPGTVFGDAALAPDLATAALLSLPVIVPGGPWERDHEERRRARHAVCDAMEQLGFEPDDATHLHWLAWSRDGAAAPIAVPFEWYTRYPSPPRDATAGGERDAAPKAKVLVTWLREADVGAPFAEPLARFARQLFARWPPPLRERVTTVVIGPRTSEALARLVTELRAPPQSGAPDTIAAFVSPTATAPLRELGVAGEAAAANDGAPATACVATAAGQPALIRATTDDREMVGRMAAELRDARGFVPGADELVLVTEFDSAYTRLISSMLLDELGLAGSDAKRLRRCSFRRGLEGQRTGGEADPGDSQVDYVTSFADRLVEEARLGQKPPRAIGIVAGDIFDKLLLLRALRPRFPATLFFTFDLDARLLDPGELPFTRNLLVASHFGLDEKGAAGKLVALSRGANQTAIRRAVETVVVAALPDSRAASGAPAPVERLRRELCDTFDGAAGGARVTPSSRVWEVGLHGAVDLALPPNRTRALLGVEVGLLLTAAALLVIVLARAFGGGGNDVGDEAPLSVSLRSRLAACLDALGRAARQLGDPGSFLFVPSWVAVAVGTLGLLVFGRMVAMPFTAVEPYGDEPFILFAGVSTWPTIALLLVAAGLGSAFLLVSRRALHDGREALAAGMKALLARPGAAHHAQLAGELAATVATYRDRTEVRRTNGRMVGWALLFGGLIGGAFLALGIPAKPTRGPWSHGLLVAAIAASAALMHLLLFCVCDAVLEAARWLRTLRRPLERLAPPTEATAVDRAAQAFEQELRALIDGVVARVERLVHRPFVVLAVMIVARSSMFDGYDWPPSLVATYLCDVVLAVSAGAVLQRAVAGARALLAASMDRRAALLAILPAPADLEERQWRAEQQRAAAAARDEAKTPLFGWLQSPALFAQLLPFGGLGAVNLVELLSKLR